MVHHLFCTLHPCAQKPAYTDKRPAALSQIFVSIWDKADAATRTTLAKVCKLWKDVRGLDQTVVAACEGHMGAAGQGAVPMAAAASAASTSGRPYAGAPQPGLGRPQVGVGGNRVPFDPRALGPQAVYQQPAASFPQRPAMASTQPPISVSAPSYPQQPTYTASAPPAILVPLQGYGQQQQLQAQPQFIAVPHPQIPGQFQYLPIPAGFQAPQPSVLPPVPMAPLTAVQPQSMPPRSPQVAPSSPEQAQALQQLAAVPGRPRSTVFPAGQLLKVNACLCGQGRSPVTASYVGSPVLMCTMACAGIWRGHSSMQEVLKLCISSFGLHAAGNAWLLPAKSFWSTARTESRPL